MLCGCDRDESCHQNAAGEAGGQTEEANEQQQQLLRGRQPREDYRRTVATSPSSRTIWEATIEYVAQCHDQVIYSSLAISGGMLPNNSQWLCNYK